jgi:hypothetical protein
MLKSQIKLAVMAPLVSNANTEGKQKSTARRVSLINTPATAQTAVRLNTENRIAQKVELHLFIQIQC